MSLLDDHPALSLPGPPNSHRLACPFCRWFKDFDPQCPPDVIEAACAEHIARHVEEMADLEETAGP